MNPQLRRPRRLVNVPGPEAAWGKEAAGGLSCYSGSGIPSPLCKAAAGKFEWQRVGRLGPQREKEQKAVARRWLEKSQHKLGIW